VPECSFATFVTFATSATFGTLSNLAPARLRIRSCHSPILKER
jgi:hypothetical protein